MTKTIILLLGPENAMVRTVPVDTEKFTVVHPKPIKPGRVLLSMRRGIYKGSGQYDILNREMFTWEGWEVDDLDDN